MYKSLVIIGGGFAGTRTAQALEHALPPDWTLTLVSQENFITFNPLLPEVVGASILPGHVIAPHRQMVHCSHVCMAQVTDIDTANRTIHYLGEGPGTLRYDQLVLACGTNANLDIIKGMGQYALPLKTLGDALFLRNRVIARLEQAELQPAAEQRRWLLTFVVVGGGFSGVETAGELVDFLYASLRYYKRIRREDLRIVLLHSGERLLPELSASLGRFTERKMRKRGIEVRLGVRAVRVTDRDVQLDSGDTVAGGTVICTIGTEPNPLLEQIPAVKNRGRLVVNPDFSVPGVDGVWAAGDCAAVLNARDGQIAPPTAQLAEAQARQLAANIIAKLKGAPTRPFRYRAKGQLSAIGHNKAVAEIFGVKISGFVAWLMWRGLYLLRIPTFARKTRLFLEWNWAMLFPPDIAHLGYRRTHRRAHTTPARASRQTL
ncbi:MAG TPA: NAD(P)/FAD-dependent oxidoreductase [Steroidobacteraceae bacterium]|nr:NAD(P)/FAD-dependent oxidoreductase [Steroidobacteraceae bacterium]